MDFKARKTILVFCFTSKGMDYNALELYFKIQYTNIVLGNGYRKYILLGQ